MHSVTRQMTTTMANIKQFKTRDSATAFMRKHGVTKEYYNNFLTTDIVGGKPVFIVDVADMETFIDLGKLDEQTGGNAVSGNYSKEDENGNITPGEYYNEDGSLKKDEPKEKIEDDKETPAPKAKQTKEQPEKTSDLGKTKLGQRLRERQQENAKPTIEKERRKRVKVNKELKKDYPGLAAAHVKTKTNSFMNTPPTKGIQKQYPDIPTNSIRKFCIYLILEGLDNATVFGAMKEVFGEDKCVGKTHYPQAYRNELIRAKQLNEKGKPIK